MNHNEFIGELSQRLGVADKEVTLLAASVAEAVGQELQNGKKVAVSGFGLFEVQKRIEHIELDAVTRQRLLVPPQLLVSFHFRKSLADTACQCERQATLPAMAAQLARRHDIGVSDAEKFVELFFRLIEEGLRADDYVKVKGLGAFKMTTTGANASEQEDKDIVFVPDTPLRDNVNKPFSHFETVVLKEHTHFDDMEEPVADPLEDKEAGAEEPPAATGDEGRSDHLSKPAVLPVVEEERRAVAVQEEVQFVSGRHSRQLPWCLISAVLLAGVLLGGMAVWHLRPESRNAPSSAVPVAVTTVPRTGGASKDTAHLRPSVQPIVSLPELPAASTRTSRSGRTAKAPVSLSDAVRYDMSGTKTTHTLRKGENLAKLAQRYYGNRKLWPYLVKYNQKIIKDVDNVPVGLTLRIPELVPHTSE